MPHIKAVRAIVIHNDKLLAMKRNKFGKQYYTLIGGEVNLGEDLETALRRELSEETGVTVGKVRPVFVEDGGFYGIQYVFLCEYKGGELALRADSDEAKITVMGKNIYEPVWLPLSQVSQVPFRSASVAEAVLNGVANGFPSEPQELAWKAENVRQ